MSITKAWDYDGELVKTPKTRNGVRSIPIEPSLVPLLRRMLDGKPRTALAVPMLAAFGGRKRSAMATGCKANASSLG